MPAAELASASPAEYEVTGMRRVRARLLALLALILVALPLGATGRNQYLCHAMGRVMDECCCPTARPGEVAKHASGVAEVKARSCCELLERSSRDSVPALREGSLLVPAAELATTSHVVLVVLQPPPYLFEMEVVQARAPPPRAGPSIFLQNCSLLT